MAINVWVVEDDASYRRTLVKVLTHDPSIAQCRAFPSCIELFETLANTPQPDAILMDLGLPRMGGVQGIIQLRQTHPDLVIVVLTVFSEKEKVLEAIDAGAAGYLLKSASSEQIVKNLQDVINGGSVLSPEIAKIVLQNIRKATPELEFHLAAREIEVLEQLSQGCSVKEIARNLDISHSTVSTYLARIYSKLQVQSQSGAVAKALRNGIIS